MSAARGGHTFGAMPRSSTSVKLLVVAALSAIIVLTLAPESSSHAPPPFWCLSCGRFDLLDVVLNVVLFVPLGIGLGLWPLSARRAVSIGFLISATVETLQLGIPGRESSARDIVMNTIGTIVGVWLVRRRAVLLRPSPRQATTLAFAWALGWLGVVGAGAFALQPASSSAGGWYRARSTPRADEPSRFRGTIVAASLRAPGAEASADGGAVSSRGASGTLDATFAIQPGGPTSATLVEFEDRDGQEVYLLSMDGRDIVFRRRLRATRLTLRNPSIAVHDALPPNSPWPDTLRIRVAFTPRDVLVDVATGGRRAHQTMHISPLLGWAVLIPFDWPLGTFSAVETALWTVALLLPLGYFASLARRPSWSAAPVAVGIALAGLGVLPRAFGLAPERGPTWIAAVSALALGAALGARVRASSRGLRRTPAS